MKKKILSLLLALGFCVASVPAYATLTKSTSATKYSAADSTVYVYSSLITAASNDTTATADSSTINNQDGSIKDICAGVKATNQTGTSPTLTVSFLGSFDNSVFFSLKSAQSGTAGTLGTMASSALDISTASTTNVGTGICLSQFGLNGATLPPHIRIRVTVGGSGSPGWTGVAYASVKR